MTRGDSAFLHIHLCGYHMKPEDIATLSVKKKIDDEDYIFQVVFGNGCFYFPPALTKNLEEGKYIYDIQIDTADGQVYTVVEDSVLVLKKGVNE